MFQVLGHLELDATEPILLIDVRNFGRVSGEEVAPQTVEYTITIPNVAERLVAVEAEHSAHRAGLVIVIRMVGIRLVTDRAQSTLCSEHPVNVTLTNPIAPTEVIFPAVSPPAFLSLPT
jgi:hypothetical protein